MQTFKNFNIYITNLVKYKIDTNIEIEVFGGHKVATQIKTLYNYVLILPILVIVSTHNLMSSPTKYFVDNI